MVLLALRRKQRDAIEGMRTCSPEDLPRNQAVDAFVESLFEPEFAGYIVDTFVELRGKQKDSVE